MNIGRIDDSKENVCLSGLQYSKSVEAKRVYFASSQFIRLYLICDFSNIIRGMDDDTRNVLFESMKGRCAGRRHPIAQRLTTNKSNRKLYLEHKQLERECSAIVRQYLLDVKIAEARLHKQRFEMTKKRERLQREQTTLESETKRRHAALEEERQRHLKKQRVALTCIRVAPSSTTFQLEHALAHTARLLQKTKPTPHPMR
ncbi:hypothetical protein CAPTEDRAFT_205951 [Capitella teleta]|uniref:Uncharacterized protein n=1 Tax=Capitella teleta TaxID=283909 RepID=R7TZD0_CAPTE|nr:hypothetical protein CAPTEDRAFT_205951 [Capitella teleta]|eukprot:ELT98987.1 hypothetical protein CAPTEDRAFT_205951 [Capitella teleta]